MEDIQSIPDAAIQDEITAISAQRDALFARALLLTEERDRRHHQAQAEKLVAAASPHQLEALRAALAKSQTVELAPVAAGASPQTPSAV